MSEKMNINVSKFFARYNSDEALRERIRIAEENYPGSLELREALAEDILLPVAEELGMPFTVMDLYVYESRLKSMRQADEEQPEDAEERPEEEYRYWLVDRGWKNDEAAFCGDK
ncbi:MAG: hypothetical protein HUJ66_01090 [Oscillospiraceae bacterium]|nr:hypothetical protein [Oscillospiraceae bacterium]